MTKKVKRLKRLFRNPKTVSFKELDQILRDFKFEVRQPGSGSSHYVYTKGMVQITVPFRRPYVLEVYVKRIIELIGGENNEENS